MFKFLVSFFEAVVTIFLFSSPATACYSIARLALAFDTEEEGMGCFWERLEVETLIGAGFCY
jgi:hypothetical protein